MCMFQGAGRRNDGGTGCRENVSGVHEERKGKQSDETAEKERKKKK